MSATVTGGNNGNVQNGIAYGNFASQVKKPEGTQSDQI